MCEENCSNKFWCVSGFWFFVLFATSLVTMIFSILTPKDFKTFEYPKIIEKSEDFIQYNFLYNITFQKDLQLYDNYKSTIPSETKCYLGKCQRTFGYDATESCSKACKENLTECYYYFKKCKRFKCFIYDKEEP